MAIWKLTIEDDEGQKTVVPLVRDEYTVGRREGHTIRLTERNISRDHARIRKTDGGWSIEDLGSYNGVFVNGHRLSEPQRLQSGDLVLVGDYRIEAHDDEARAVPAAVASPRSSPPVSISSRPGPHAPAHAPPAPPKDDLPHRLVVLIGDEAGRPFPLEKPHMTVGRGEDVDVRLNHTSVSRHHCAIDALDGGRFEVLDSGSANGIRVNGQEVKKALLAPGDTIELGDLILKYVPAGQTFVLDASAAEAARELERRRKKSGGATWAIVALAVVSAAIAGIVIARSGGSDGPPTAASGSGVSDEVLVKAVKLKESDLASAHALCMSIPKDSALRKDARFTEIENAWCNKAIAAASAAEGDKKRALLTPIAEAGCDDKYKSQAKELLAAVDDKSDAAVEPPPPEPTPPEPTAPTSSKPTVPTIKPTGTLIAPPTVTNPPTATAPTVTASVPPKPTASATTTATGAAGTVGNCPSWKGDYAAAMRSKDYECVKQMLSPRLNSGAISQGEARYLKAACVALGDSACAKRAAEKL